MTGSSPRRPLPRPAGLLGVAFYVAHAIALVRLDMAPHVLWSCHVANLVVAGGILFRRPDLNAVGFLWLLIGLPMWFVDLAVRGEFHPTATLTHVSGFLLSAVAAHAFGFTRGAWWKASAGLIVLWLVSRLLTPQAANVNVAWRGWYGFETDHAPYAVYALFLLACVTGVFFSAERFVLRRCPPRPDGIP
jgi:hypothetical protein